MTRPLLVSLLVLVLVLLTARRAGADPHGHHVQVSYIGVHPIPASAGGGFCNIEGPHVHVNLPERADVLFRIVDGKYLFVGDPVAYGYDGEHHAYYGPHPIPVDEVLALDHPAHDGTVFCYLEGPHYHAFVAPPALHFVERGGAAWYIGDWPTQFTTEAPRYRAINAIYAPLLYPRPIVIAAAPIAYHVPQVELRVDTPPPPPRPVSVAPEVVVIHVPWFVVEDVDYDLLYYRARPRHHPRSL